MLTLESLPKVYNRFHSHDIEVNLVVNYPVDQVILSGTKTQTTLENRKTGETLTLDIFSKEPLRPCQLRSAINQALGDHWQYKILALAAFDYEF